MEADGFPCGRNAPHSSKLRIREPFRNRKTRNKERKKRSRAGTSGPGEEGRLMQEHTFLICAYKESPYLEDCIRSLKAQTVKSDLLIATSTPNRYISDLAEKYHIPLYVNEGESGIVQDWNFAYHQAKTPYVTIAHQDDVYYPEYAERMLKEMKGQKRPLIWFCDYEELRDGKAVRENRLLKVKRFLLLPLRIRAFWKSIFVRRRILSLGCPICCPSVSFARENLPETVFRTGFRSDEDWEAWEMISRLKGSFLYEPKILMAHRIHEESETTHILQDNERNKEDYTMYCKFWPKWIARILARAYSEGEKSNDL